MKISREDFLLRRKSGIGGSDVAAIMGLSKYRTAYDVWLDKTSDTVVEQQSDVLALSSYLEAYTAQKYADLTGFTVKRWNSEIVHPQYKFLKGNIDREIMKSQLGLGVLECKALSNFNFRKVEMYGLPDEYVLQIQHYFLCAGHRYSWGAFAILNRDNGKLLTFNVFPDREIGRSIIKFCVPFWIENVEKHIAPKQETAEVNIPKFEGKIADLNDNSELALLLNQRKEMKALCDETKELLDGVETQIKETLGDVEAAECGGFRVYYRGSSRTTLDSSRIKKELPDVFAKYSKVSESNRSLKFYNIINN